MRHQLEVRMGLRASLGEVSALAADAHQWPSMPGAPVQLNVTPTDTSDRLDYSIEAGLPVRDHCGCLVLADTGHGGTELVFSESFRPRIWGTGGFLRARRERALIDTARHWDEVAVASRSAHPSPPDVESAT